MQFSPFLRHHAHLQLSKPGSSYIQYIYHHTLYLEREQARDDINLQLDRSNLCDSIGCLQQNRVVGASFSLLIVDHQSLVEVLLCEGGCWLLSEALQDGKVQTNY